MSWCWFGVVHYLHRHQSGEAVVAASAYSATSRSCGQPCNSSGSRSNWCPWRSRCGCRSRPTRSRKSGSTPGGSCAEASWATSIAASTLEAAPGVDEERLTWRRRPPSSWDRGRCCSILSRNSRLAPNLAPEYARGFWLELAFLLLVIHISYCLFFPT